MRLGVHQEFMKKFVFCLVTVTVLALSASAQRAEQNRPPIIDVHVHAYAKDERWTQKVPNPRTGQPLTATTEQAHMQATLR